LAAGGGVTADAKDARIWSLTEVRLLDSSEITGNEVINVTAHNQDVDVKSKADSDLDSLFGTSTARSKSDLNNRTKVEGQWEALLRTAELNVSSKQNGVSSTSISIADADWFGTANDSDTTQIKNARREIFWESHVYMLGEPNPELEVDASGKIVKMTNVTLATGETLGQTIAGPEINVNDIVYDEVAEVTFFANEVPGAPLGEIWGNHALFEIQHTWDYVRLTNYSDKDLRTNLIDVVDGGGRIDIKVDNIPGPIVPPALPNDNESLDPDTGVGETFEFDLDHIFPRTILEIKNLQPGNEDDSNIILDGHIENAIGVTRIRNERGNIHVGSDGGIELIRTNELDLDAITGSIGQQDTRLPISVELVKFKDRANTTWDIKATADAHGDVVMDLTANRRTGVAGDFEVPIQCITAGDDVDLVINDSKEGNDLSDIGGVTVNLYNPEADGSLNGPLPPDSKDYFTHFRPDGTDAGLENIRRAFGITTTDIDSTYNFQEVRAGDDIDIGHITTESEYSSDEPMSYNLIQITLADDNDDHVLEVSVASDLVPVPDKIVNFNINTDVDWPGGMSELDGIEQIFLTTNGNIEATELIGDMLVGHIHSTDGDVTLKSPRKILDADSAPMIDVTGVNITMSSGMPTSETPSPDRGGIGDTNDYLEINVDRNNDGTPGTHRPPARRHRGLDRECLAAYGGRIRLYPRLAQRRAG